MHVVRVEALPGPRCTYAESLLHVRGGDVRARGDRAFSWLNQSWASIEASVSSKASLSLA
ncbi:MAG TPA: hypothetical protein VJV79_07225 [Polyangiaceae bacterium]|nr:hypothetical protein [Polyangiaceae bacterium]